MTEARRDGRNGWTTVVHYFIGLFMACDALVTCYCISHSCCLNIMLRRLKHIDVKWLCIVNNL
jgi:hypothetical protein